MDWNKEWQQQLNYLKDYYSGNLEPEEYMRNLRGPSLDTTDPARKPGLKAVSTDWLQTADIFDWDKDPTLAGMRQKEEDEKEVQKWMDFAQSENEKNRIYGQMDREGAFERGIDGWRLGMLQAKTLTDMKNTQEKEMEAMRSVQSAAARPWSYMLEKSRQNMDTLGRLYGGYLG